MDIYQVLVRPLVTEKGTHLAGRRFEETKAEAGRGGTYSFEVHRDAGKAEVREAIEKIYNVRVMEVRLANRKGKKRRNKMKFGQTPGWKKAYVQLHPDFHIDLF
ncbi:MAG: 50S ribosomal protein L23 [Phycisphaerae bacterium]